MTITSATILGQTSTWIRSRPGSFWILAAAIIAPLWYLALPALIAYPIFGEPSQPNHWWGRVMRPDDVANRIALFSPKDSAPAQFRQRAAELQARQTLLASYSSQLSLHTLAAPPFVSAVADAKAIKDIETWAIPRLPFAITGFSNSSVPYMDLINGLALIALFYVGIYRRETVGRRGQLCWWKAIGIAVIYVIVADLPPDLFRICLVRTFEEGRRGYAYNSFVVNRTEECLTELQMLVAGIILAMIWMRWLETGRAWTESTQSEVYAATPFAKKASDLAELFGDWQRNSLILAAAYMPYSYFDWMFRPFGQDGDTRYFYIAIVDHGTWLVTWVLMSRPLVCALGAWRKYKATQIELAGRVNGTRQISRELLKEAEPIGNLQLLAASIAGAVGFLFPLVGLFK